MEFVFKQTYIQLRNLIPNRQIYNQPIIMFFYCKRHDFTNPANSNMSALENLIKFTSNISIAYSPVAAFRETGNATITTYICGDPFGALKATYTYTFHTHTNYRHNRGSLSSTAR